MTTSGSAGTDPDDNFKEPEPQRPPTPDESRNERLELLLEAGVLEDPKRFWRIWIDEHGRYVVDALKECVRLIIALAVVMMMVICAGIGGGWQQLLSQMTWYCPLLVTLLVIDFATRRRRSPGPQ